MDNNIGNWISVKDKLPKNSDFGTPDYEETLLVIYGDDSWMSPSLAFYSEDRFYDYAEFFPLYDVTHYVYINDVIPLPKTNDNER
jgi:hypothetical protein